MSSVEELEALCAEFSQNFNNLSLKFSAQSQEMTAQTEQKERLQRQLHDAERHQDGSKETIAGLRKELEEMQLYKEKYYSTSVAYEHLKGRLESARKGVTDKELEHQHEVEHLRSQIGDLVQRIDTAADGAEMQNLRQQKIELEERCAIINGQLLEERERANQAQITSNNVLRELQSRNTRLEQQCKAYENEIAHLRNASRKTVELHTESELEKEKQSLSAATLAQELEHLRTETSDLRRRLEEAKEERTFAEEEKRAEWERETATLTQRLHEVNKQLETALSNRQADDEKYATLQRTIQKKVAEAKNEMQGEIDTLMKQRWEEKDAIRHANMKVKSLDHQLEELRSQKSHLENRMISADQQRSQLQSQVEMAVQQETWANAEKDRLENLVANLQRRVDDGEAVTVQLEHATIEVERLRMQLKYSAADAEDAQKNLEHVSQRAKRIENESHDKVRVMFKELREAKKSHKAQLAKADYNRKKLLAALVQREQEISGLKRGFLVGNNDGFQPLSTVPTTVLHAPLATATMSQSPTAYNATAVPADPSLGLDVLSILKGQSDNIATLSARIGALTNADGAPPVAAEA